MTIISKTKDKLHANACMLSVAELLHLMMIDAITPVNLGDIMDQHGRAIAAISDEQIDAYIATRKARAGKEQRCWRDGERELLSTLAIKLRVARDGYAKRAA